MTISRDQLLERGGTQGARHNGVGDVGKSREDQENPNCNPGNEQRLAKAQLEAGTARAKALRWEGQMRVRVLVDEVWTEGCML